MYIIACNMAFNSQAAAVAATVMMLAAKKQETTMWNRPWKHKQATSHGAPYVKSHTYVYLPNKCVCM